MGNLSKSAYKRTNKSRMRIVRQTAARNALQQRTLQEVQEADRENASPGIVHEQESIATGEYHINENLEGRRIVNLQYLFSQILNGEVHKPFDCTIVNMSVVREKRIGLKSFIFLKCNMCGVRREILTEDNSLVDINSSAVLSTISNGCGYTAMEEMLSTMNIPPMSIRMYQQEECSVSSLIQKTAWNVMEEAGKEEARLALQNGDIDTNGVPLISVIADGAWCKRSYGKNYDSNSGVGCIVGANTGKRLYLGVRNKYCTVCARSDVDSVKIHKCFKNWTSTSTSMESDIILDGFKHSLEHHGVIYHQLIGDGDSSIMKKINDAKPYGLQIVSKIECTNHLLRNYCNKLRELCKKRISCANKIVPICLRRKIKSSIARLRYAVTKAAKFRKLEAEVGHHQRIEFLKSDIKNSPYHVFGDHENCAEYFCEKKVEENFVPQLKECGVFNDILSCIDRLVYNSSSLITGMTNNHAELYNAILCKFVGGKRINFSQKGSYEMRCYAAAISYNAKENYYSKLHNVMTSKNINLKLGKPVLKYLRKIKMRRAAAKNYIKKSKWKKQFSADTDYGAVNDSATDPTLTDLSKHEFEQKENEFLATLHKADDDINRIELETRGQSHSTLWRQERSLRITASHFGRIYKLRQSTSAVNVVKEILYPSFGGSAATEYGLISEPKARRAFAEYSGLLTSECGFYIGRGDKFYLGASPDGLVGDDGLLEIKCPRNAADMEVEEAIQKKIIKYATLCENNNISLKSNHIYMYQIQGQMLIANKNHCYFMIWTNRNFKIQNIFRDYLFWDKVGPKIERLLL